MHGGDSSGSDGQQSGHRMLLDATAGALAGCISRLIVGPLDVIKIRFQVQLEPIGGVAHAPAASKYTGIQQAFFTIWKEEGIAGLWRGTLPGQLLSIPYTAVQFVALQQCKELAVRLEHTGVHVSSPVVSLLSGAMAGAAGTLASYPFDLLRTTLAAQGTPPVYRGLADAMAAIVRAHGPLGLYRGVGVTILEIMPYAALQFGMYDLLNTMASDLRASRAAAAGVEADQRGLRVQQFSAGLVAGMFAKLVTHPLDVAKKRYQVAGLARSLSYGARVEASLVRMSLLQCLAEVYRREGVRGLWKGGVPNLVKAAPAAAFTFVAYEAILARLLELWPLPDTRLPVQQMQE